MLIIILSLKNQKLNLFFFFELMYNYIMAEQIIHSIRPILYEMSGDIRQVLQSSTSDLGGRTAGEKINVMCPLQIFIMDTTHRAYEFPDSEHALSPYLLYVYKFPGSINLWLRNLGRNTERDWFVQPITPLYGGTSDYTLQDVETGDIVQTYSAQQFTKNGVLVPYRCFLNVGSSDNNMLFLIY